MQKWPRASPKFCFISKGTCQRWSFKELAIVNETWIAGASKLVQQTLLKFVFDRSVCRVSSNVRCFVRIFLQVIQLILGTFAIDPVVMRFPFRRIPLSN